MKSEMDILASLLLTPVTRYMLLMFSKVISPLKRKMVEKIKSNVPSKENVYFGLYYTLLPNVDFGKNRLGLAGVVEFDSSFGTILKDFEVDFRLSNVEWEKALNVWGGSFKNEKTILKPG